ncbi:MAG: NUDIX hydrolase, partial [Butyrivibrio sp.]|nr:NUDIX hydrolase [Butyrivibrio sp.]
MEELFDITDENGFVTGQTVTRSEAHDKGIMHRTAHIWIVRKKGESYQVLLQKRSAEKESFPSMYDTSSAGHIQAGDEPL